MARNPYAADLGTRDPIAALAETPERIRALVGRMSDEQFARSYASGKWTTAQLLDHLAEAEMIFGVRVRMALTIPNYVVQPFDQDKMMAREPRHGGRDGFDAYYTLRRWNLPLFRGMTPADREIRFTHPEWGEMKVGELLALLAGHELHHLPHFEKVVAL